MSGLKKKSRLFGYLPFYLYLCKLANQYESTLKAIAINKEATFSKLMKRLLIIVTILLTGLPASARKKADAPTLYIYRYTLADKKGTPYSVKHPEQFLSPKAIERRRRQGLAVNETDLPVSPRYLRQFQVEGAEVVGNSRWQNSVIVRSADTLLLQRLGQLACVKEWRCVWTTPKEDEEKKAGEDVEWIVNKPFHEWDSVKAEFYGGARQQIQMLNGHMLHQAGFRGEGMTIAILDGGFQNYDRIPALQHARVLGTKNFVAGEPASPERQPKAGRDHSFHAIDHGTKVFSAMAAYAPEVIVGTAPDACYWLLRSEDNNSEQQVEEDYWTMAAEYADSVGVDVINSSLGYYEYDEGWGSYRLRDLDGQTAFVSRSASMLACKGIILCNSAGNSGMGQWKKIGVPADARDILTVGAVTESGKIASFSSVGPSQDGRMKPDVVALGASATVLSGKGGVNHDMGTSFSTPITCGLVACLWQSLPGKTAPEIMELVRQSADQYDMPNNIFGYGLPNFWKAYQSGLRPNKHYE